jgi:16S rRNA (adenine1518-N6/adenine1519-N6)-dimethyltransferase
LTILVAQHADVTRLLDLPPGAFRPPPAVRSTVVRLRFRPSPLPAPAAFELLVKGVFRQRRKTIANALRSAFPELTASSAADLLARACIEGRRRPETLEIAELTRLAELLSV